MVICWTSCIHVSCFTDNNYYEYTNIVLRRAGLAPSEAEGLSDSGVIESDWPELSVLAHARQSNATPVHFLD